MYRGIVMGLALMLGACSGGGGGDDGGDGGGGGGGGGGEPVCQVVGGSSGSYSNAGFTDPAKAFDGNLGTFATLSPQESAAATISGSQIDRMAGEIAGVAI